MLSATAGDDNTFRLVCDQVDSEVLTVLLCVTLHVDMGLSGLDSRFLPTRISKFLSFRRGYLMLLNVPVSSFNVIILSRLI
jgi:hypothetical protein